MSIKLKQPTMRLATLFFYFLVNLVMWWNGIFGWFFSVFT